MGIDYENIKRFTKDEGMELEITPVKNISELISKLKSGEAHMAAYPVPSISEYNDDVLHCGPIEISRQVLVQRAGESKLTDVTELIGKDIYVEKDSKFHYRLLNLDEELGGGINIIPIESDTISSEDILKMVNDGRIQYAVLDSEDAGLYSRAFPNLDSSMKLSADQSASWVVAKDLDSLAAKIDRWENRTHSSDFVRQIYKGYYDQSFNEDFSGKLSYFKKLGLEKGKSVSVYDNLFKKYSATAGVDWKVLAAIAFCESNFNPDVASRFGAYGLMQVMPSTAKAVGIDPSSLGDPSSNVLAAAKILARLDNTFKDKVEDPEERMKFIIASYNSGVGHIFDSMAIAEKLGMDPQTWTGNVSIAALMKSRPEYYNDPVVKHGFFRGRETVDFVDNVIGISNFLNDKLTAKK